MVHQVPSEAVSLSGPTHIDLCRALSCMGLNKPCTTTLHQPLGTSLPGSSRPEDYLWPDCPTELRDFVPDGIILTHAYPPLLGWSSLNSLGVARSPEEDEMLTGGGRRSEAQSVRPPHSLPSRPIPGARGQLSELHHQCTRPLPAIQVGGEL
eukprot:452621-Rhodomonas_salina.1